MAFVGLNLASDSAPQVAALHLTVCMPFIKASSTLGVLQTWANYEPQRKSERERKHHISHYVYDPKLPSQLGG